MSRPLNLPQLKASIRIGGDVPHETNAPDHPGPCQRKPTKDNKSGWCTCQVAYDVQFYPYTPPNVDPVFAVVRGRTTIVYRPSPEKHKGVEVLRCFEDANPKENLNSLAWSQDLQTGDPLLCVAGNGAQVKILDVKGGQLVQTLVGHGGFINDLAVSPLNPSILASCSMDHSIRIWTLDPKFKTQPCAMICSGETHKDGVLTISFHSSGRYLLSAGLDTVVNMWAITALPDQNTGTGRTTLVRYPHFSTTEVHAHYIDCVCFYGDLILSKAAKEDQILLWSIDGFSSAMADMPVSGDLAAPRKQATRSAFGKSFQRLLTFNAPDMEPFYMRFGLFHQPQKHPILAVGNTNSKVFFWDLQRLEENVDKDNPAIPLVPTDASTQMSSVAPFEKKYMISDPFYPIPAHRSLTVPKIAFASRKAAWSIGGEWCVVVGDLGMICVFHRRDSK